MGDRIHTPCRVIGSPIPRDSEIAEVRSVLLAKGRKLGTTAAVLNAGVLREHVESASADHGVLDILHGLEPKDPSYAGIYELRRDDTLMEIAELIAQYHYPAKV